MTNLRPAKNVSAAALVGIWSILMAVFVITILFVGREILMPLALAALITFLLSPLVARLERWIGRIAAVLLVIIILFGALGGAGWLLARQVIDLAAKLPDYQSNIETKLRSIRLPKSAIMQRATESIEQLQKELPAQGEDAATTGEKNTTAASASPGPSRLTRAGNRLASSLPAASSSSQAPPIPVKIVEGQSGLPRLLQQTVAAVVSPLGTAALVFLLAVFMLLKREDLRGRIIRLIGQGHISETTRAMDDAAQRVSSYLLMQCVLNAGHGLAISVGLYFIGVPNAILWGAFAGVLRFIPYVGPWIGAAVPILLSFAVSASWLTPIYTLGLFLLLELVSANVLEPWLYGSSTGVSSLALIISAVFWTWLWGPVGLLLATPLTVCLAVMGRHVPRLQFLSVLLSEEQALSPAEECYHRLLASGVTQANSLAERYLKANSLTALYDNVFLPVIIATEVDVQRNSLEEPERVALYDNLADMTEDFGSRPAVPSNLEADKAIAEDIQPAAPTIATRVLVLPARAERDKVAGLMLEQLLRQKNFDAETLSAQMSQAELAETAIKAEPDAICISVVPPSTLIHARFLTRKLRQRLPNVKIVTAFWGATENVAEAAEGLRNSGADETVVSFAEAVVQLSKFGAHTTAEMESAALPENEEQRLEQLYALRILDSPQEAFFDDMAARLSRVFQVPIAFIAFVDREQEWFKAQVGLPAELETIRSAPRALSICSHTVETNALLVVEDIARDRRFANNPLLQNLGLRFYAGTPLRINNLPVGTICLLDRKPHRFSEENRRLLQVLAEEVVLALERRLEPQAPQEPVA